jgi:hypothetical protein
MKGNNGNCWDLGDSGLIRGTVGQDLVRFALYKEPFRHIYSLPSISQLG